MKTAIKTKFKVKLIKQVVNDNSILNQDTDNTETGSVPPIENDVLNVCIETEKIKQIRKARELVNPAQILKVMQEHLQICLSPEMIGFGSKISHKSENHS